jgi:hypothetical protein
MGPPGANFDPDDVGIFSELAAHDAEVEGFSFLSTDGDGAVITEAVIFVKLSAASGNWSAPIPFQGPVGDVGPAGAAGATGPAGPTGPSGTNFQPGAIGTFAGRATYNTQPAGFSYLSTNGDGGANPAASIYMKASATSGDWGPRIPFAGPQGLTGPAGAAGAGGPAGPQGAPGLPGAPGDPGVGVPVGGSTGQKLVKASATNYDTIWVSDSVLPLTIGDRTTNFTLALADEDYLRLNSAIVVDIPLNSTAAFPIGTVKFIYSKGGTGAIVTATGGVTLNVPTGAIAQARAQSSLIRLTKVGTNAWDLAGDLITLIPYDYPVALSDETTDLVASTNIIKMRAPFAFYLTGAKASLSTTSSSGNVVVDVNVTGTGTVLSTKITVEAGDTTSLDAASQPVVSGSPLLIAADAEITFDIDSDGTGARGLKATLLGLRAA